MIISEDALPSIAGIAFMFIEVRIGLGWSFEEPTPKALSGVRRTMPPTRDGSQAVMIDIMKVHQTDDDFAMNDLTLSSSVGTQHGACKSV